MKLKFDSELGFQKDAVSAVVDLFDGQPLTQGSFEVVVRGWSAGELHAAMGLEETIGAVANSLSIGRDTILKNLQEVQERGNLDPDNELAPMHPDDPEAPAPLNFSVEMETGTGKTYVYLRTIFELNRKYGFRKFVIVVPSVAIREGVLKNLAITSEHFRSLYNGVELEYFVYDAKRINRLRQFAVSDHIQILVINIDAFRKNFTGTDDERKSNVIYKESDRLSGRQPIEFVRATRPIVVVDEPQSVDNTERAVEAIRALNPLCTLRYSATHRNHYNLVHRLDPVRAFKLGLVKRIVVASVTSEGGHNHPYVKLLSVDNRKGIKASVEIDVQQGSGVKRKKVGIKDGDDLFSKSNEREQYRSGHEIAEISAEPGNEFIRFSDGRKIRLGEEVGGNRGEVWKAQIKHAVKRHFQKELQMAGKGVKVLSLFFIDRVANYRSYDDHGSQGKGKFAIAFEEAYCECVAMEEFKRASWGPAKEAHNGYFSQDKATKSKPVQWKDTRGDTQADDDAYNLIMRDKERLLSIEEPLRFIFSHSALREGWDNPNVFQICTLNETTSTMKKRQEIGRGLRLPVNQDGERIFDENVNRLTVVANESYEDFAAKLQNEYEDEYGITFGKIGIWAFASVERIVDGEARQIGRDASKAIFDALVASKYIETDGRILPAFDPAASGFDLDLPEELKDIKAEIIDVVQSYRIERHIKRESDARQQKLNKLILLGPEFANLWQRIKAKTVYAVDYSTEELVLSCVKALKTKMEKIKPLRIDIREGGLVVENKGITTTHSSDSHEDYVYSGLLPDILAYLQDEIELTRATIVRVLQESGRLREFLINPQAFMGGVVMLIREELHKLLIAGIKYERIPGEEYRMMLFEEHEKDLVSKLFSVDVTKSVYDCVEIDSEVEREFARRLDERKDIKLFVKLPRWFLIETPIGGYNPDWAVMKVDGSVVYMVRETKATKNFEKLRNSEAEKVHCGRRHFAALGVDFDVVTSAAEV